jgi:4-hydroxybenzoate polyprenyltransferase
MLRDKPTTAHPDGQVLAGESLLVRYLNFVKLPHTLFALPFALLGVLAASFRQPVTLRLLVLVVVAFSAARWAAMGFNQIADRRFDAANPRNRNRVLPRGRLTIFQAWASVVTAAAVFLASSWLINPVCGWLAPVALAWVLSYSFSKRFTHLSHVWLGLSLAVAPVGGYLAVAGRWSDPWWLLPVIAAGVTAWVAGFDILYALPDESFDRSQGLKSAVVRLGVPGALSLARALHAITIPALALFGWGAGFGWLYFAGVAAAAGILLWEHRLVRPDDLSRLNAAFFSMNAVMSVTVFAFALADRLLP